MVMKVNLMILAAITMVVVVTIMIRVGILSNESGFPLVPGIYPMA